MAEWIDSGNYPKEGEEILMTYNNFVICGWFSDGRFYYNNTLGEAEEQEGITHWMPLPLPPKSTTGTA